MGNAVSADEIEHVAKLQEQLADLERSAAQKCSVGGTHRQPQWHAILPHQVLVDGAVVSTRKGSSLRNPHARRPAGSVTTSECGTPLPCSFVCTGVRVLVGPVVGKVDFQSARILLEVDQSVDVTCHVSAFHAASGEMHEVAQCQCTLSCTAGKPAVFHVKNLLPGRDYKFSFGGIHKDDLTARNGRFHTPSLETETSIHAVAVSGNSVYDMERCEVNLWRDVKQLVARSEIHFVVHLGGQVVMERMFDQSCSLLMRHASITSSSPTSPPNWVDIEARAMELLRSAYRTQWNAMPDFRFVLAHASNVMIWSDMDIYPAFTTRPEFYIDHEKPTIQMQVVRTVTRCARRLYHEYQRQLWDDDMDELLLREDSNVLSFLYKTQKELVSIAEKAMASTARIYELSQQLPIVQNSLDLQKKRREIEGARRVEKQLRALEAEKLKVEKQLVSYNQLLAPTRGEEFAFCIGEIGFLFLDLRSTRLEPGGSQAAENDLMSNLQWEFVEKHLESSSIQLWVVCSELPVVDGSPDDLVHVAESFPSLGIHNWWGRHPDSQARLLGMLFDWKMQQTNRDFVMLAGASSAAVRFAGKASVKDTKMRTKAEQFIVGAITATSQGNAAARCFAPRRAMVLHERFEAEHNEISYEKAFATVLLARKVAEKEKDSPSSSSLDKPVIEISRISTRHHAHEMAKVLLGPVVGFVDDCSAVVLLEVDRDFDVRCRITNPLTGETRKLYQHFHEKTPNSFYWTHLRPEHYYQISFENIQSAHEYEAGFSTIARFPTRLEVIAVCHSNELSLSPMTKEPKEKEEGDANTATALWEAVADTTVTVPFSRIHVMIHLGGQFCASTNAFIQEALALADSAAADASAVNTAIVVEKLRQMYRLAWNVPGVREALAHGAHIMLSNANSDELEVVNGSEGDELVRSLLLQVHQQYHNLLLPPSKRVQHAASFPASRDEAAATKARASKPLCHAFGAFGLFVLPIGDFGGTTVHASTWDALRSFLLSPGLLVLIVVTQNPILEDSMEDVVEKARVDAAYRSKFAFYRSDLLALLELLFDWKRASSAAPCLQSGDSAAPTEREVVFLSGTGFSSFDSIIEEVIAPQATPATTTPRLEAARSMVGTSPTACPQTLLQYVVGPLSRSPATTAATSLGATVFPQGTLFHKYSYHHFFATKAKKQQQQGDSSSHDVADAGVVPQEHHSQEAPIANQFAHIAFSIQGDRGEEERSMSRTRSDATSVLATTKSVPIVTRWSLICPDAVEPPLQSPASSSREPIAMDDRYHRDGRIASHQAGSWALDPVHPVWLDQLLAEPLSEEETERIEALRTYLRDKEQAIRDSFDQVARLKDGLVALSCCGSRTIVPPLSQAFSSFHSLSGAAFRTQVRSIPSPFVISHTIQQMHQEAAKRNPEPEKSAVMLAGSIDAALYHRLFEQCFANAIIFEQRLEKYWM